MSPVEITTKRRDAEPLAEQLQTFRRIVVPQKCLGQAAQLENLTPPDPEDEGTMIVRNVSNYTPEDTSSYPRRFVSLAVPPCEPQT